MFLYNKLPEDKDMDHAVQSDKEELSDELYSGELDPIEERKLTTIRLIKEAVGVEILNEAGILQAIEKGESEVLVSKLEVLKEYGLLEGIPGQNLVQMIAENGGSSALASKLEVLKEYGFLEGNFGQNLVQTMAEEGAIEVLVENILILKDSRLLEGEFGQNLAQTITKEEGQAYSLARNLPTLKESGFLEGNFGQNLVQAIAEDERGLGYLASDLPILKEYGFLKGKFGQNLVQAMAKGEAYCLAENLPILKECGFLEEKIFESILNNNNLYAGVKEIHSQYSKESHPEWLNFWIEVIVGLGKEKQDEWKKILVLKQEGLITNGNGAEIVDYYNRFSVFLPHIWKGFLGARLQNKVDEFEALMRSIKDQMITTGPDSQSNDHTKYRAELENIVFPNNTGGHANHENSWEDRTSDLKKYNIDPVYKINMGNNITLRLKEGESIDVQKFDALKNEIYDWQKQFQTVGFEKPKMQKQVEQALDMLFEKSDDGFGAKPPEQKIFFLLCQQAIGNLSKEQKKQLKNITIGYQFAYFEDIQAYIQGTNDRVAQATNKDFAYLSELYEFFADNVKDAFGSIVKQNQETGFADSVLEKSFEVFSQKQVKDQQTDVLNRNKKTLDIEGKKGLRKNFGKQVQIEIQKAKAQGEHIASLEAAKRVVRERRSTVAKIIDTLNGPGLSPEDITLKNLDISSFLQSKDTVSKEYDSESFTRFMEGQFLDIFGSETAQIKTELLKFETESGEKVKPLQGIITKNTASGNGRRVGGICTAGDEWQWNDPHYLQMVLKDPESLACKGIILMHEWEEDGKRYLIASFNPSSTYLYNVDQVACFAGIKKALIAFAKANDIDALGVSQNTSIRTNRTGGVFEKTMEEDIKSAQNTYGKDATFSFAEAKEFSKKLPYSVQAVDLLWMKAKKKH